MLQNGKTEETEEGEDEITCLKLTVVNDRAESEARQSTQGLCP